jgi:DNA polymerase elongation subunit (family B)
MSDRAYVNGFVDGAELVLLFRDEAGKLGAHRRPADWSSFHEPERLDAQPDLLRQLREANAIAAVTRERGFIRIRYRDPQDRKKVIDWLRVEHGVASYEGDVDCFRRFFADTQATVQKPRRVFLDIETDSRVPPAIARRGKARVLCWSLVDEDERVVGARVLREDSDEAERELLEALWAGLDLFDQVVAWFGDDFDFPIVKLRSNALGAKLRASERWLWMDQMVVYERMNKNAAESGDEKESLALESVCRIHLKEGKSPFDSSHTWEAWEAGGAERLRLLRYCVRDTTLLAKLERKLGHLAINDAICEVSRLFADTQSANPTSYVNAYLLRLYQQHGHRAPTRVYSDAPHEQFAGAYVLEPQETGIVKDVHVLDFSGMYPSIAITWNMSPETVDPLVPVNGPIPPNRSRAPSTRIGFRTDVQGLLALFMKEVRALRKFWLKKQAAAAPGSPEWWHAFRMSTAYKVIANSAYGVIGSPFSPFFVRAVAESIAQTGVWLIHQTMDAGDARGLRPIYGDTDSSMVRGPSREQIASFVGWCNASLYPPLVAREGCVENCIEIAYEKEFERVVFVRKRGEQTAAKKKYFGVYRHYKGTASCTCDVVKDGELQPGALDVWTMTCRDCGVHHDTFPTPRGKPEIRGLEYKKGDSFKLLRNLQLECINKLMIDLSEEALDFVPIVERARTYVLEHALPVEEVTKSKSLGKPLNEYKGARKTKKDGSLTAEPEHVRVARILKQRGEMVGEGTKIAYVVTDATVTPQAVIPAADYQGECDRHHLWDSVWGASRPILEAAFPSYDWSGYDKTRPGKTWETAAKAGQGELAGVTRNPGSGRAKKSKLTDQVGLFGPPAPALSAAPAPDGPFEISVFGSGEEETEQSRMRRFLELKTVFRAYPGSRDVLVRIAGHEYATDLRVAVSPELVRAVEQVKRGE